MFEEANKMEAYEMIQTMSALSGLVCLTLVLLACKKELKSWCTCR